MKIKTTVLKEMIGRAVRGASNNKIIPITSLISVVVKGKTLTMTTTDATNYLAIFQEVDAEDFEAVVPVDLFSKLISKVTTKEVEFEVKDDVLEVKANGVYKIPLPVDEDGNVVSFPEKVIDDKKAEIVEISEKDVVSVIEANKAAVAVTVETPYLTGYYFDDSQVVTTNAFVVCVNKKALFKKPVLLAGDFVALLEVIGDKKVTLYLTEKNVYAISDYGSVYGHYLDGIEDFPIEAINEYLESDFTYSAKIKKVDLEAVLDRMSLFVADYDKNAVNLKFSADGIELSSKKLTGVEFVEFSDSLSGGEYDVIIDIELLKSQLAGHSTEEIEIHYGNERAVKISSNNVVHLVALFEEE